MRKDRVVQAARLHRLKKDYDAVNERWAEAHSDIIGYKSIEVQDVSISVNKTTRLDVDLEETAVEGEVVFVKASKLSTKKDQSGTIKNISEKQIEILPIKDVSSIVSMQAGVVVVILEEVVILR